MSLGITRLGQIAIYVADLDRSVEWYRKVVGLKETGRWPATENATPISFMRIDDWHHDYVLKELPREYDRATHDASDTWTRGAGGVHHIAFEFGAREDWLNAMEHVRSCGVEIVQGPQINAHEARNEQGETTGSGSHAFYFCDPDGNRIEFYCWMMKVTRPSLGAPNPDL